MVGRISFGMLMALLVFVPEAARAQVFPAYQPYAGQDNWTPESPYQSYAPGPNETIPVGYSPYGGGPQYAYGDPGQGPGVLPVSATAGSPDPAAPGPFPVAPYSGYAPYPPYNPGIPVNDASPWELAINKFHGTEFGDVMGDALNGAWFRMEYLLWTIDDPGSTLLGSPILNVQNPREFFEITAPVVGFARVSDVSAISLRDTNGGRTTIGIPLTFATVEVGGFVLQQAGDHIIAPELPNNDNILIATSTLLNGEIGDLQRFYDLSFEATWISEVWGMDVNIVRNPNQPGEGLVYRPLGGFKFLSVRENLTQIGYTNLDPDPNWKTIIDSDCSNNIYAVNFGLEMALVHRWFTIGMRPQIALGLNSFRNQISTTNWVTPTEGRFEDELSDTQFTALGELTLFARVPIRENFNVTVGFTGLFISDLERPDETIIYNTTTDNGTPPQPTAAHFRVKHADESLGIYGLNVGAELIFR